MKIMKIIDGNKLAQKINLQTKEMVESLEGKRPGLAIILVGEREDSKLYVELKEKQARKIGIETHKYVCGENAREEEILEAISHLNSDPEVDAVLVQLPLPDKFDTDKIISAIDPNKDVDRFHPQNVAVLRETCSHQEVMPPVLAAVLELLANVGCELQDKNVCVVANSEIFGKSLKKVLECKGAKVRLASFGQEGLEERTSKADVLISATGKPLFIKKEMLKQGAAVVDIGITKKGKKVLGDVDLEDVQDKVSFITPVPGGVGPVTVAMLLRNTVELAKAEDKNKISQ